MLKSLKNESGMIMIVVVTMIIIMTIVVVGLVARNFSSATSAEIQRNRIEAERVARTAMWRAYSALSNGQAVTGFTENVNGRAYVVTYSIGGADITGVNSVNVLVSY